MKISNEEWKSRFVAHMIAHDLEAQKYAESIVDCYLLDRNEYDSPEEAAQSDIDYWEL